MEKYILYIKAGIAIYVSDKDLKNTITKGKESHYITIKGSNQQEDITFINIYASNIRAPQYIRQMLTSMKRKINTNTQ